MPRARDPVHEVAGAVAALDASALSEAARDAVRRLVLDSLAVGFAGAACEDGRIVGELVEEWGGRTQATVLGRPARVPSEAAALANGTMIQALDYDDTHDPSAAHTASTVLAAALAAGERCHANGRDVFAAVCAGVEVIARLGLASEENLGFTSTSVYGAFGAAAAAARVSRLDAKATRHALGIVLSQAGGTTQTALDKPLSKHMQSGFAAQAGVLSATLAQRGVTGVENVFLGRYGFLRLHKRDRFHIDALLSPWSEGLHIEALSYKPFPSCRATHAAVQAALALFAKEPVPAAQIDGVIVHVPPMSHELAGRVFEEGTHPLIAAQFSIPYAVACALTRGRLGLEDFTLEAIRDSTVRALAARVSVSVTPGEDFTPARVEVYLASGRILSHTVGMLLGSPGSPMDADAMRRKVDDCLAFAPAGATALDGAALASAVDALEACDDVGEWMSRIVGHA